MLPPPGDPCGRHPHARAPPGVVAVLTGRVLGLTCAMEADFDAWSFLPANQLARVVAMILAGPYRLEEYGHDVQVWLTNRCPAGPKRAPMAVTSWIMEGRMGAIAPELGLDPAAMTYFNSTHACALEIEPATGALRILRHVVAEDAGTRINPLVVEGQTHGATAMGLSGAMLEHAAYAGDGQALAGSFMDYALARAADLPDFTLPHHDTPSLGTPAGIKGMAEGGTMGGIGALMNAVNDALARAGAHLDSQPATPARIWAALQAVKDTA